MYIYIYILYTTYNWDMLSLWSKSSDPCVCHSLFEYNWAMEVWSNNWALWQHPWLISSPFLVCHSIIVSIHYSYDCLVVFFFRNVFSPSKPMWFQSRSRSKNQRITEEVAYHSYQPPINLARIWHQNQNLKRTTWLWPSLEKSMKANGLGQLTHWHPPKFKQSALHSKWILLNDLLRSFFFP